MYSLVATISLLSLLSTTATAVSLADFKPKIPNLPARCETVYRYPIEECVPEDFQGNNACSDQCRGAIQDVVPFVDRECAGVRVGADTIIGIFLAGNGVTRLCPNARSPSPAPAPAPIPPPPSENDSRGPSNGQSPSEDLSQESDDTSLVFAPSLGPSDTFNGADSTGTPADDDIRGSQPTGTASGDSTDAAGESSDDEGGNEDDDDDDEDGGDGSPFDDEGGNSAIPSSKPNILCLVMLFAAFGIFNIT